MYLLRSDGGVLDERISLYTFTKFKRKSLADSSEGLIMYVCMYECMHACACICMAF